MPQNQNIQLRLMVPHHDTRPDGPQPRTGILNPKPHTGEEPHAPFESPGGSPLAEAAVADEVEGQGGEGAVGGAEEEGEEGEEGAGVEGEGGGVEGFGEEEEEERGGQGEGQEEGEEGEEGGGHCFVVLFFVVLVGGAAGG